MQWEVSDDHGATWTAIAGGTDPILRLTDVTLDQNGSMYRAVFTNSRGTDVSSAAELTVNQIIHQPWVRSNPTDQYVAQGNSATFTAAADGKPTPTVQWQARAATESTWTDIAGATSTTLTLDNVTLAQNGSHYRAVFANVGGSATTSAALLTVTAVPAERPVAPVLSSFSLSDTSVAPGDTVTISYDVSNLTGPSLESIGLDFEGPFNEHRSLNAYATWDSEGHEILLPASGSVQVTIPAGWYDGAYTLTSIDISSGITRANTGYWRDGEVFVYPNSATGPTEGPDATTSTSPNTTSRSQRFPAEPARRAPAVGIPDPGTRVPAVRAGLAGPVTWGLPASP